MYEATFMPAGEHDFSKKGFETESLAWEYVYSMRCDSCKESAKNDKEPYTPCDGEWWVDKQE